MGADLEGTAAGGFEPIGTEALGEAQNAETGPEALLGMSARAQDHLDEGTGVVADAGGLLQDAPMGPVVELAVLAGHVIGDGDVGMGSADPGMGRDAPMLVEHLDGAGRHPDVDLLLQQPVGHGVEAGIDLDVVGVSSG